MDFFKRKKWFKNINNINKNNIINVPYLPHFRIQVNGKNNRIEIKRTKANLRGSLVIFGDNNTITINDGYDTNININIGVATDRRTNNCKFFIDSDLYCGSAYIVIGEDNFNFSIGNDCMFANNIDIYGTDGHTIINNNGKILNIGREIMIGNHVWVGKDVKINKNTIIPNNCVIGWNSVVTRQFHQDNCVIAGNPAMVVKENISWLRDFPQLYRNKSFQEL